MSEVAPPETGAQAADADELHRFLFEGEAVRGVAVRLGPSWREALRRRSHGADDPPALRALMGQMAAVSLLMQSQIKFNGALILQVMGDGPVKLAVAEAQPDLAFRCTIKCAGEVGVDATLADMVNVHGAGRCAITLDPQDRLPGQQPYQGVVPLNDALGHPLPDLAAVLEQYMRQSEQLDTRILLAAGDRCAAGLLVQRMPTEGGRDAPVESAFERMATLAASLTAQEMLALPPLDWLHRLFWQEKLLRHEPQTGLTGPRYACRCTRERVAGMIRSLGQEEAQAILSERGHIEVGCDFCGLQYRFDAVDAAGLFAAASDRAPGSVRVQ